jgi:hypothetical protein
MNVLNLAGTEGKTLGVLKTETVKAKIAQLPITDLSVQFLVQVLEPIKLIPRVISVPGYSNLSPTALLSDLLLKEWHDHFALDSEILTEKENAWISKVDKVQLVECDLLLSKEEQLKLEVEKLDIQDGGVYCVKAFGPDLDQTTMNSMNTALKRKFPKVEFIVLLLPEGNDVAFDKLTP